MRNGCVDLRAAAAGHGKAAAELNALNAADGEHRVAQKALHAVEPRLAHAGGQAAHGGLGDAAHAVLPFSGL